MKKRTGLSIAGGVLEIIAGVSWLGYALIYILLLQAFNLNFAIDWVMFILPICFIFYGVMACVGVIKSSLRTYAIINFIFIGYLIYKAVMLKMSANMFIYTAIVEIILLLIASLLFLLSKKSEYEIVFDAKMKEYLIEEPAETNKDRKKLLLFISLPIVVVLVISLIIIGI